MAQPTLLSIAKADLKTASRIVNDSNKHIKHQSAYMTQQSVEKTLKYLISLHRNGLFPWGHDIRKLILDAQSLGIYVPELIVSKADVISLWETSSRYYPTQVIRRDSIQKIINATYNWHILLAKQGIR